MRDRNPFILADLIQMRAEERPDHDVLTFEHYRFMLYGSAQAEGTYNTVDLQTGKLKTFSSSTELPEVLMGCVRDRIAGWEIRPQADERAIGPITVTFKPVHEPRAAKARARPKGVVVWPESLPKPKAGDSVGAKIDRVVRENLYTKHPYIRQRFGTPANVARFTTQDVRKQYETYIRPNKSLRITSAPIVASTSAGSASPSGTRKPSRSSNTMVSR